MSDYPGAALDAANAAQVYWQTRAEKAEALHRDLVSRLGFGDNITEPMADNDTVVEWFEERGKEASEWVESQRWRDECINIHGHSETKDCFEHDPTLRLEKAEADRDRWKDIATAGRHRAARTEKAETELERLRAGVKALAEELSSAGFVSVYESASELGAIVRGLLDEDGGA